MSKKIRVFNGVVKTRAALLFATALTGLWITPSFAQNAPNSTASADPADSESGRLETVVVTAQRRVENLQDTPISISVLTARSLENRRVGSLLDLGDGAIPSLSVKPFFTRPGALIVNIRGVGVITCESVLLFSRLSSDSSGRRRRIN